MKSSGYKAKFRNQVIHGSLAAYQCRLRLDSEGVRDLYRSREYKRQEREDEKLLKKENWFRVSSGQQKPESVIFVTATPGSELARNIKQRLKTAQIPVRVAENSGPKLSQILVKTNPY